MLKKYTKPDFIMESLEADTTIAADDEISNPNNLPPYEEDKDEGFGPWIPLKF